MNINEEIEVLESLVESVKDNPLMCHNMKERLDKLKRIRNEMADIKKVPVNMKVDESW